MHARHLASLLAIGAIAFLGACAEEPGGAEDTTAATTMTTTLPTVGDCDASEFRNDFTDPVVVFCDGAWARAGQAQTDNVLLFRFQEDQWRTHPHDGRSEITAYICYNEDRLRTADAPEELISQVLICGPGN